MVVGGWLEELVGKGVSCNPEWPRTQNVAENDFVSSCLYFPSVGILKVLITSPSPVYSKKLEQTQGNGHMAKALKKQAQCRTDL